MGRKKEEHEKEPNHERWLVSYADFITLLFAVFVTLYAMSQVDKAKVAKVIASTNEAFGVSKSTSAPAFNVIDTSNLIPMPNLLKKSATDSRPPGGDKYKSKIKPEPKDLVDEIFKAPDLAPVQEQKEKVKVQEEKTAKPDLIPPAEKSVGSESNSPAKTQTEQKTESKAQGQDQIKPAEMTKEKSRADIQEFKKIKENIVAFLQEKGAEDKIKLDIGPRGLVISLKDTEFFDSGKANVRARSMYLLDNITAAISKYSNSIRIEGHTDNIPIKTSQFPSNWELSTARATNIVHYLIDAHEFPPGRISAIGYGEYRPIADNSMEEGRQKNRRVDVVVLSSAGEQGEPTIRSKQQE
jgi:flagellar motor protein MotB